MDTKKQSSVFSFLDKFEDYSVTVLYIIMVIVILLQVFFRFVIKASLPWSEELARYIMAWAVFIGSSIAAREGAHIGIDSIVSRLPNSFERYIRTIAMALSFIFSIVLVYLSVLIISFLMKTGQKTPAMMIPMWIAYFSVLFGAILMSIRFCQVTYLKFKDGRRQ
ncbi:MAG: C4-dicarboxylate transporter, DctQ subunit [Clostridia bacterium]|jgi:C4-dicarboxylate transporter DctQ subunit|nr:C4-dicarboxylate transporter, DctQ subunit [Clostridia bacterium]MDN5323671.1 C4-dicarboxylate transporter, DctQ subunit [Clostridia bacterium]